jgi:hypothetical protein
MHPIPKSEASIPKYANNFISSKKNGEYGWRCFVKEW